MENLEEMILGINGLGRVGKLLLWTQVARKEFGGIIVNLGREAGNGLNDIIHNIFHYSTYGNLGDYLFGMANRKEVFVEIIDENQKKFRLNGMPVTILTNHRNPAEVRWNPASLVVDATGQFKDPNLAADHGPKGSLRGHLSRESVKKVIVSCPFKLEKDQEMPRDATMFIMGINETVYSPKEHLAISSASCTTTCLSHMLKPLTDAFGTEGLKSLQMLTIHAKTGKQSVLDHMPKEGKTDPVEFRSTQNNIFISTTGAAKALKMVMPEIENVPLSAKSIRVPTVTGSLVVLTASWIADGKMTDSDFSKKDINNIYKEVARQGGGSRYLRFSEKPLVSSDIIGSPNVATVIEGSHTDVVRAGNLVIVTAYGWYDNELGSYVNMLADHVAFVAKSMQ